MKFPTISLTLLAVGLCAPLAHSAGDYDTSGGWQKLKGEKTGYTPARPAFATRRF